MRQNRALGAGLLSMGFCGLSLLGGLVAHADTAILVGVGQYPLLGNSAALSAVDADLQEMSKVLRQAGFTIVVLKDEAAGKPEVKQAVEAVGRGERLVFYASCRGTSLSGGRGALVVGDSQPSQPNTALTLAELGRWMRASPAAQKWFDHCRRRWCRAARTAPGSG